MNISIAKDFSTSPGPRYIDEGPFSGQQFREEILRPKLGEALEQKCQLQITLDGTAGYGTSFLEESFGGLIREDKIPYDVIKKTIQFVSNEEPELVDDIEEYLADAHNESKK
jgi:hypothetical protein